MQFRTTVKTERPEIIINGAGRCNSTGSKMDITLGEVEWNLRFHHHAIAGLPMVEPRVVVCMDSLYDATSTDICLSVETAEKLGHFERTTESISMRFRGRTSDVLLKCGEPDFGSAMGMFDEKGEVPVNTKVIFWVIATHINSDNFPSQVCIGMGSLQIYPLWKKVQSGPTKEATATVVVGNRSLSHGEIRVTVRRGNFVKLGPGLRWSSRSAPSVDEEVSVAKQHARREGKWISSFEKEWGSVDNMVDLYGFLIGGYALPISFFLSRNRSDIREQEWKVLLYYALKRYCIEKGLSMQSIVARFSSLPMKQKCAVLGEMVTLLVHSHSYMTDYVIDASGRYRLLEIFQSASRGNSGDCEDFSRQLCNLWETFSAAEKFRNPILAEMQAISRLYIAVVSLDRTSVPKMNAGGVGSSSTRQFRTKMERRMWECQGRRRDVSAHMNVFAVPRLLFFELVRPDLSPGDDQTTVSSLVAMDKEELSETIEHYRETYDEDFDPSALDVVVLEGTGNFNCVNEADPHPAARDTLSDFESLSLGKHKIYHPVGDPKQFYLNTLIFITPYFLKRYRKPVTTFVCAYEDDGALVYGTTYSDLIRKSRDICLVPMWPLAQREAEAAISASRRNYRHPFSSLRSTARISSLADVENFRPFENLAVEEARTVVGGTSIRDEADAFSRALENARVVVSDVNKIKGSLRGTPIVFSFSYIYFASDDFLSTLADELASSRLVKSVSVYPEVFGETMRNIVLVVSV